MILEQLLRRLAPFLHPFGSIWVVLVLFWLRFELFTVPFRSLWLAFGSQISERNFLEHFQQSTLRKYQAPWPPHPTVLKGPERNLSAGTFD